MKKSKAKLFSQESPSSSKVRLFIDPASISSGWALFEGSKCIASGTVLVNKKDAPFIRLKEVARRYLDLSLTHWAQHVEEVHIEQLPRSCHIYTHYSVCAAAIAFASGKCTVAGDIPVQSWQKYVDWNGERKILATYKVESEDQQAAIGMGLYYTAKIT